MQALRQEKSLNIANLLTVFRIALLPAIVWRFCAGDMRGALGVYLLAMLSDAADGYVARRFNQITALGKLLDPLADKLCLMTLLGLFVLDGQVSWQLLAVVLLKELLLVIGSLAALKEGVVVCAHPIGKLTTAAFVLSMCLRFLAFRMAADVLLWLSVLLSLVSFFWYITILIERMQPDHPGM